MSEYHHDMSFDERCRQPLDAAARVNRHPIHKPSPEAVAKFFEWCQKFKQKQIDKQQEQDILQMLRMDR